jgi:hypothetical protein
MRSLTHRLERDLREVAAAARPSPAAWESIVARLGDDAEWEVALVRAPDPERAKRQHRAWPAVAAAALVVLIGSVAVLTRAGDDDSSSIAAGGLTTTFVSPRNGFSVGYFDRGEGTVTPANQVLGFGGADDGFDVVETGLAAVFKGGSAELVDVSRTLCYDDDESIPCPSIDEQIDDSVSNDLPDGCGVPRRQQAEITIDGHSGRVAECANRIEATVAFGGRFYLFTLLHDRDDARAVFDAFIATIELTPWTALDFPALPDTFVSPTYGYSFGSLDRGGITPASELWDPGNQPVEDIDFDPRFDAVETGLGAYLEGASTPIPDGVSIDAWVDEHVTPRVAGGCGVPRSQQEEVTIDGQSGRIAQCDDHIEATVVAGGRLYLFILGRSTDARAMFDPWVATIELTPETATVP